MTQKRQLYNLLGVSPDATEEEIARVYRRLALQYHPDRNPGGESKFKEIANAYSILSDSDKRRVYDATGIIPGLGENEATNSEVAMAERSAEMKERVQMFYSTYAGSEEEIEDVISCFNKCKGNFRRMIREHLLFDNTKESEIQRLQELVHSLVTEGKLQSTEAWKVTNSPGALKQIQRSMRKERKEAASTLEAMGLSTEKGEGSMKALQALMKRDQEAEWSNMMSNLESKYLKPKNTTKDSVKQKNKNDKNKAKKREPEGRKKDSAPPSKKLKK